MDYDKIKETFATRLKMARKKYHGSQESLAASLGMGQSTISMLETSKANPSLDDIIKLSRALGVSIAWLLGIDDKPYEPSSDEGMFSLFIEIMDNTNSPWSIFTDVGKYSDDEAGVPFFNKLGEVAICTRDKRFKDFVIKYKKTIRAGNYIIDNYSLSEDFAGDLKKRAISEFKHKFEKDEQP